MPPSNTNLLQGTLDVLILKVLGLQPMHGLGISNRIAQVTSNTFLVKPGSLFPALHRMEEAGWLTSSWGESENNRRAKFYRLTAAGGRQLKQETDLRAHCRRHGPRSQGKLDRVRPGEVDYALLAQAQRSLA